MEFQIEAVLQRNTEVVRAALSGFDDFLSAEERQHDVVLKELFYQILAVNPLHIKSHTQGIFWTTVRRIYERLHDPDVRESEYTIILDAGEAELRCSFAEGLLAILITLVKSNFPPLLLSVKAIPHHIVAALLQRAGLRRFLKEHLFSCVEDRIDLFGFFRNGQIGQQTFELLLDEQYENDAQSLYETPNPELDPRYVELVELDTPSSVDLPSTQRFLDALPPRSLDSILSKCRRFASPEQHKFLAGLYVHVWSEVAELLPKVPAACFDNPKHCRCCQHLFSIHTLLDLVQLFVSEHIDIKALARPAVQHLFAALEFQPVLARLESIAADVRTYLLSEPCSMRLGARMLQHADLVANHLHPQLTAAFTGAADLASPAFDWECVRVDDMPVEMLLMALDVQYAVPFWAHKLRCFLAGKARSMHFAYAFPSNASLYDVELTLSTLQQAYDTLAPGLFETFCTIALRDSVFVVCPAESMHALRSLMLLSAVKTEHIHGKQMLSSDVFLRAFAPAPHQSTNLELYCAVAALVCYMDGGPSKLSRLATPDQAEVFSLYRLLPDLASLLVHSDLRTEGYPILQSFLFPFSVHWISYDGLECLVDILNTVDTLTPVETHLHKILADRLKKLNPSRVARLDTYRDASGARISLVARIYRMLFTNPAFAAPYTRMAVLSSLGCGKVPAQKKMPVPVVSGAAKLAHSLFVDNYLKLIKPFWTPETVATRIKDSYGHLASQDCLHTTARWTPNELDGMAVRHYLHLSRVGRAQFPEFLFTALPHGIVSLIGIYHHAEWFALKPVNGIDQFSPLAWRTSTLHTGKLLPLAFCAKDAPCYFENSFFLRVERTNWPRKTPSSSGVILSAGDQAVLDSNILRDLAVQFVKPWPLGTLSASFRAEFPRFSYLSSLQQRSNLTG